MKPLIISMVLLNITATNAQSEPVKGGVYHWDELPVVKTEDRESRKILEGVSPHFEYLEIHATTQAPGAKPSTAHANEDIEECILVIEGKMKVAFENESTILDAGGVLLLMPKQMHSLQNIGDTNLTYYVMRYKSKKPINIERGQANGGSLLLNVYDLVYKNTELGGTTDYFNRPTSMCETFEMHATVLNIKGPSHTPHAHFEGEIFLVVSGNTEMTIDGKEYKGRAGDLFFIKSQLMHGMRNATDHPCKYFVFKWN